MPETLEVYTIQDRKKLADALIHDPFRAAYLLADLENPYFANTRWYAAGSDAEQLNAVILIYTALKTPALLPFGDPLGLERILEERGAELPDKAYGMIWPEHKESIGKIYDTQFDRRMIRMGLEKSDFRPAAKDWETMPLHQEDLDELTALMEHYPGNFFEPAMFRDELYYGIRMDGRLVSAGGIHTYSPTYSVAAIGNIVTHKVYRRRGLALACTAALVKMLLEEVDSIALNVEETNEPAIQCYKRLGFVPRGSYTEGLFSKWKAT
ncbi:MAG: GNAT family N-acetyltransferase [Planctomycetota bacterium]|jgi:RimJ/RimL family protein N-acetyltransferase